MMTYENLRVRKEKLRTLAKQGLLERDYAEYLLEIVANELFLEEVAELDNGGMLDEAFEKISNVKDYMNRTSKYYLGRVKNKELIQHVMALYDSKLAGIKERIWGALPIGVPA